jgi:hypothetical protein
MHVSVSLPRGNRKSGNEVVELALWEIQITVARQRRTFTGFAIKPSHPGERAPHPNFYSIVKKSAGGETRVLIIPLFIFC